MHHTFDRLREVVEQELAVYVPVSRLDRAGKLNEALQSALFPGGKRMRPVLALLSARLITGSIDRAIPAACAIEFLHTSSLILDDLPAMDDAATRRGRPALHLIYGESLAMLTALALMTEAYALFGRSPALIEEAALCVGVDGAIGGQSIDLELHTGSGKPIPFAARNRKTSAIMRLTLTAGAIASNADPTDIAVLAHVGECLGEAYQVCDDLLDQRMECEITGKTSRQDSRHVRPSYALEFGLSISLAHVADLVNGAKRGIAERFGSSPAANDLFQFIDCIVREFHFPAVISA